MNRIKVELEKKGLTQTWLAENLGKSYNMVNAYAQNRRQPSIEQLYKIAILLKLEAKDLLVENINITN
jgi:repressor LexA